MDNASRLMVIEEATDICVDEGGTDVDGDKKKVLVYILLCYAMFFFSASLALFSCRIKFTQDYFTVKKCNYVTA